MKLENNTGKMLDLNEFDLSIFKQYFLWKISTDKPLVEKAK